MPDPAIADQPIDDATAATSVPADAQPHRWSLATRIAFRFAFCYLGGYCLLNGNCTIFAVIPKFGESWQDILSRTLLLPAQWAAGRIFHVAPPGDKLHPTGSGDTAIIWIAVLFLLLLSVLAAALWSILDRRRPNYQTLSAWLRFLIRLTLGLGMVTYGMFKVFPMQMPAPSIISLSEPLGMHSPMALLWNFIGVNPAYETVCGAAELIGGLLLLFRRTALFGSLVTAFVVTNVLLYNLCFDVPVKLYAAHLLLLSLFVALPDAAALIRFFWFHQDARPTGVWVPPSSRRWFRRTTVGIEISFVILAIGGLLLGVVPQWRERRTASAQPSPLRGSWRIDSATIATDAGPIPHPVLSQARRPFVELDIDSATRAAFRDDLGANTIFTTKTDTAAHTLQFIRPDKSTMTYLVTEPATELANTPAEPVTALVEQLRRGPGADTVTAQPRRLTLTPTGPDARTGSTLALTLATPAAGYPLLIRGFHWVSEYPYQR